MKLRRLALYSILSLAGVVGSHADLLVYEPFDYTPGSDVNTPLAGGLGFTGQWTPGQQGGVITVYDAATAVGVANGNVGGEIEWDGVIDNVPTTPAGTGNRYIGTGTSGADRITAQRTLAQSAGALAGADNILWVSVVWHQQGSNFGRHVGFALGTDDLANRSVNIDSNGSGIGVGGAFNTGLVTPAIWINGNHSTDGTRTTTGATSVSFSEDNLVVLKFEFGATDTVTAYTFTESATLDEATFNANAISATAAIDESTFTILSFSQSRGQEAIDEIRLGDSFADVVSGLPVAGAVDAGVSTVVSNPASVPADGATSSTITVTLKDANGLAVVGESVTLAGNGSATITAPPSPTTDAAGEVSFTVASNAVGVETFTATVPSSGSLVVTQTADVDFLPVNVVDADVSTVVASPAAVDADGVATSTITVTLKNAGGSPIAGKDVSLGGNGTAIIDPATPQTTDGSGEVSFTVSSTTLGVEEFTATDETDALVLTQTASVEFLQVAGPVDDGASTVAASPVLVPADGATTSTITVTLRDAVDFPVEGKSVTLSGDGAASIVPPGAQVTDSSGQVTFEVSSGTPGIEIFTATNTSDTLVLSQTASVGFVGPADPGTSTVVAAPATVLGDGITTATVTVTLLDANGLAVEGRDVSLAGDGTALIDPAGSQTTDAAGQASFAVSSSALGVETFTATNVTDTFVITQTAAVDFVASDPRGLLVYEPFDYTPGSDVNTPLEGGIGFTGAWSPGQQGGVITVYDAVSAVGVTNNNAGGEIEWDGVVDNLPTTPVGAANRYIGTSPSSVSGIDRITANRTLSQSAGALAGPDRVLWASIVWHQQGSNFGRHVGFALGTDGLSNRSANADTSGNFGAGLGNAIGVGGAFSTGLVTPVVFDNGGIAARTTDGATSVSFSEDNIVVLKFSFADGAAPDTVTAFTFKESDVLSEAAFDAGAVSASAVIDQDTLNILSFSQSRGQEAIDEIRLGNTFDDIVSAPLALITEFEAAGVAGVIDQAAKTITLDVPFGTDLSTLAPDFTLSSGTCDQTSGSPPSPTFATQNPVDYVVTDTSTDPDTVNTYSVTVNVAPQLATLVIDLGAQGAGTEIKGGAFIGSGPTNLPLPSLPVGSILKEVDVDTSLDATDNDNFAFDLALLFDPTPGDPGNDFSVGISNWTGVPALSVASQVEWTAGVGNSGPVAPLEDIKVEADWISGGEIDLATTGLFLGNNFDQDSGEALEGGTWSGTITLTYVVPDGSGDDYSTWAAGFAPADLSNPGGDFDGDGLTNEEERAFGLNPTDPSSVNPFAVPLDPDAGTLNYTRRNPALTGLSYSVWTSPDLTPGSFTEDTGATVGTITTNGDIETVPITLSATPVDGKLFVEVRAD